MAPMTESEITAKARAQVALNMRRRPGHVPGLQIPYMLRVYRNGKGTWTGLIVYLDPPFAASFPESLRPQITGQLFDAIMKAMDDVDIEIPAGGLSQGQWFSRMIRHLEMRFVQTPVREFVSDTHIDFIGYDTEGNVPPSQTEAHYYFMQVRLKPTA
jgi:hypothetical protein